MNERLDRIIAIQNQDKVTGIDFVYVDKNQVTLSVYFIQPLNVTPKSLLESFLELKHVSINSLTKTKYASVPIDSIKWDDQDEKVLIINTKYPGDFTKYRLSIESNLIDPYFNNILFSFTANCPSGLDCKPKEHECPSEILVDFPIDYLARDFWSFRKALFDFASLKYPDWKDRLEADAGVMMIELMSALGDEMAYYQDRIGREAYLETASQRRSVRKLAKLVDYQVHDGKGATGWLDVSVNDGQEISIEAGTEVWAVNDSGKRLSFEVGKGLYDRYNENGHINPNKYPVKSAVNFLEAHLWDEDDTCLGVGETSLFIEGHHKDDLKNFDGTDTAPGNGKWILLITNPPDTTIPSSVYMVRLIGAQEMDDPLHPENNKAATKMIWEKDQALPFEMDMRYLTVHANIIPVTAGKTHEKYFVTGCDPDQLGLDYDIYKDIKRAVERQGHDNTIEYLFSLDESDTDQLVWLSGEFPDLRPEIRLYEGLFNQGSFEIKGEWDWKQSFLGTDSSKPQDTHFTLEDGTWKEVLKYQRFIDGEYKEIIHEDYSSAQGISIRFGDGEFGMTPVEGTIFKVVYRLGGGKSGNVPANSIVNIDTNITKIERITNPFPITNGIDPEPLDVVRQSAPEAFRAVTYRAVRPEDYAEAAERLDCVQKAGATFRWTGSWLTAFVTPDPSDDVVLNDTDRNLIDRQLNRFRQAGREVYVLNPVYADLNLYITICVRPDAFQGEVKQKVLEILFGKKGVRPVTGYFSLDHFTFGTPLDRSSLEAAIHKVEGVRAVENICIERRGWFDRRPFDSLSYPPGKDSIIRIENDPRYPERGIVKLIMEGGA